MITVKMFSRGRDEVEARIYLSSSMYFRGVGRTVTEALGSLICSYGPEELGIKLEIVQPPKIKIVVAIDGVEHECQTMSEAMALIPEGILDGPTVVTGGAL